MAAVLTNNSMDNRVNNHNNKTPFLIGVTGGTASGKSTVCAKIMEKLGQDSVVNRERRVVCVSQDSFYRELSADEKALAFKGNFDFDHPSAFDEVLMLNTLRDILDAKVVNVPRYNYKEHTVSGSDTVYPADVVLFEGILLFYFPEIRELFHMKLFVDTDSDTRLSRRVLRDVKERNRDLETVLNQYTKFVKPAFEEFCQPTKKYADVIIPRGADNGVAVDLIVNHIESLFDYCDDLHSCCNNEDTNNSTAEATNINCKCIKCLAIDLIVQTIKDLLQNRRVRTQSPLSPQPNLLAQMDQFRRSHDSTPIYARSSSLGPHNYGNR